MYFYLSTEAKPIFNNKFDASEDAINEAKRVSGELGTAIKVYKWDEKDAKLPKLIENNKHLVAIVYPNGEVKLGDDVEYVITEACMELYNRGDKKLAKEIYKVKKEIFKKSL